MCSGCRRERTGSGAVEGYCFFRRERRVACAKVLDVEMVKKGSHYSSDKET